MGIKTGIKKRIMTKDEFIATAYEQLTKQGYKEIDGIIYFPEPAVMDMFQYMHDHAATIPEIEKSLSRIKNILHGFLK